ncbi:MAG: serine/threonine-protein kinase [Planctomycetota bacterium]|nr:serine/threonine-protein kinase [Planctomycetota bacterium]
MPEAQFAHFRFDPVAHKLGEGPLSEVYRALDTVLERTVALKILRNNAEIDPKADTRFEREARHASRVSHPNITTIYEYGKAQNTSYIAMEFLEGRTLDKILKQQSLGYEEGVRIALQVSDALSALHKHGMIHRDLKPANIMLLPDGTAKLLDFGIVRVKGDTKNITLDGVLVGTVLYMSPEQVRGVELDLRSDVFAFGSVFYHALTGSLPFPGRSFPEVCMSILDGKPRRPSEVRMGFPQKLEDFLMRCLDPDPARRYADAGEVHVALLSIAEAVAPVNGNVSAAISGRILLPPVSCGGPNPHACSLIAGSMRKSLAGELNRIKGLDVELLEGHGLPEDKEFDYVLRLELQTASHKGGLELFLEKFDKKKDPRAPRLLDMWKDHVEYEGSDDFDLEAGLVRGTVRVVRKRLTEIALRPVETARRDTEASRNHAKHAHETLHKGTTKNLLAAISSFRRAIDADEFCAIAYAGLAEAMARKFLYWDGDSAFLDEARENAARALALDPDCAEAHTSLGYAWQVSGHFTDAQREYQQAIQLDNDEWLAHRLLGGLRARAGNFKNAAGLLLRAIALKPTQIGSYDHLYGVYQRLNRYEEAIETADRGIAAAKGHLATVVDNQEARLHMAMLQARLGLADEARAQVTKARETAPKDGYTSFHSACVHAILGDLPEAMDLLGKAQERGYYIQSELGRNSDLDVLRGLKEYQRLVG